MAWWYLCANSQKTNIYWNNFALKIWFCFVFVYLFVVSASIRFFCLLVTYKPAFFAFLTINEIEAQHKFDFSLILLFFKILRHHHSANRQDSTSLLNTHPATRSCPYMFLGAKTRSPPSQIVNQFWARAGGDGGGGREIMICDAMREKANDSFVIPSALGATKASVH